MNPVIITTNDHSEQDNIIILSNRDNYDWVKGKLSEHETAYVQQAAEREVSHIALPQAGRIVIVQFLKKHDDNNKTHEYTRRDACEALETIRRYQLEEFTIVDETGRDLSLTYAEGLVLGSYQFLKYYKDAEKRKKKLHLQSGRKGSQPIEYCA